MTCKYCNNFTEGNCRINPEPIRVLEDYSCSKFAARRFSDGQEAFMYDIERAKKNGDMDLFDLCAMHSFAQALFRQNQKMAEQIKGLTGKSLKLKPPAFPEFKNHTINNYWQKKCKERGEK